MFVVSLLTLPLLGTLFGILPIHSHHHALSYTFLSALIGSALYLGSVLALICLEDSCFPGELTTYFGYWAVLFALFQSYATLSITRLARPDLRKGEDEKTEKSGEKPNLEININMVEITESITVETDTAADSP